MCETLHSPRLESNSWGRKSRSSRSRAKRMRISGLRVSMHSLLIGLAQTWWRAPQWRQTTRSRTIIGRSLVLGLQWWCSLLRLLRQWWCSLFRGESVEMGPKHQRQRTWHRPCRLPWRLPRRRTWHRPCRRPWRLPCRLPKQRRPCRLPKHRRHLTWLLGAVRGGLNCSSG